MSWQWLGSSEVSTRICGESEGVVKLPIEFSEATEIKAGSRSGVQQDILSGQGLTQMVIRARFKYGLTQSPGKGLLKQA